MLRVRVEWSGIAGTPYLSTFNFQGDAPEAAARHADVVEVITNMSSSVCNDLSATILGEVDVFEEDTGLVTAAISQTPVTIPMVNLDELGATATQGVVRLTTNVFIGGRRIQGRLFIPGVPQGVQIGGVPTAAYRDDLDNAFQLLITNSGGQYVVWGGPIPATGTRPARLGTSAPVTGASTWTQFGVLRSRRD